jgi:hypothetical protein
MAGILIALVMSIPASAAISNGPSNTNAVAAEEQRILQFHLAGQSYQQQLKVGRERYNQKQMIRAKVIAAMASELQARQQTVAIQPVAVAAPFGNINEPVSWLQPWVVVAVLAAGFFGFVYYLNRQRLQEEFGPKQPPIVVPAPQAEENSKADEIFHCKGSGADGRGLCMPEGFVVLKGSIGHKGDVRSIKGKSAEPLRVELLDSGVIREEGDAVIFEKDHLFRTPSMAAMALMGRPANGWREWKTEDGKTLDAAHRLKPKQ